MEKPTTAVSIPIEQAHKELARTAIVGIGWLMAQNLSARIVGFGSQIILARILAPTDFGSLALAGTVTAVFSSVVSFGIDDVLLQRQKTIRYWATPAFLISLGLGLLGMLLVIATAPLAAALYRAPILLPLLAIGAVSMPLGALATVPNVQLRADLKFRFLAAYSSVELLVTQAATIILALKGFGVYSFVLPGPIMSAARSLIFWGIARPKLRGMKPKQLHMMGASGTTVFGSRIITALVGQGDYFMLGLFAARPVVGAYFFAFRLAFQPVQMLAGNFNNVLFPVLSQLKGDASRQREAALKASRALALVIMPYCFMQAAVARPLLSLVFGTRWAAAIPLVQILSIGLAFDAVSWVAGALLSARGEFRRAFVYSCVFSPAFFILVALGAYFASAVGVAIAVSLFYFLLAPYYSYAVFRKLGVSLREVSEIYLAPTLCSAAAMGCAVLLARLVSAGPLTQVLVIALMGGTIHLGLVRLVTPATLDNLVGQVFKVFASKIQSRRV